MKRYAKKISKKLFLWFPKYVGWGASRNKSSNKFAAFAMMALRHHACEMGLTLNLTHLENVNETEASDSLRLNGFISSQKSESRYKVHIFILCFFLLFCWSFPHSDLQSIVPLYLWPFHFPVPPYQSTPPLWRQHFLSVLPHDWPFGFILLSFL